LTEKALRPIACGRPFMLAATPGSLSYLHKYGFETFHGLIDESYDSIQDPRQRLCAIVQEIKRISCLDSRSKLILWQKLYEISARNQRRFFSTQWQHSIVEEYLTNFKTAVEIANKQVTGYYWKKLNDLGKHNRAFIEFNNNDHAFRTMEQKQQVLQWLQQRNQ
jgi:hypothetical protein